MMRRCDYERLDRLSARFGLGVGGFTILYFAAQGIRYLFRAGLI